MPRMKALRNSTPSMEMPGRVGAQSIAAAGQLLARSCPPRAAGHSAIICRTPVAGQYGEPRRNLASVLAKLLSVLVIAALLLPGAGAGHLHVCLDGAGPAISLHTPDFGDHCQHVDQSGHHDHTLDAGSPAIGKLWPPGLDAAVVVFLVLLALVQTATFPPALSARPSSGLPLHLRPPLRGPPA